MALVYKEFTLNAASIEAVSAELQEYLNDLKMERRSIQRIRLTVEELLLNVLNCPDKCEKISVGMGRQFGRHLFRLRYAAQPFDPTKNEEGSWAEELMRSLGYFPSWSYRGKLNTVSLVLQDRRKRGTLFYIVLAVLAAVMLGLAGNLLPDSTRQTIADALLSPAADGFLGLLRTFSGLMILLTICSGMVGMGDSASLGRMGKSVLLRFVAVTFVVSMAAAAVSLLFFKLDFLENVLGDSSPLIRLSRMFFDILPSNIVEPFQTGNAMQIIVIAVLLGVSLLAIGERGSRLRTLVNDAAAWLQNTVSAVCALIPVFVFVMLLQQFWAGHSLSLLTIYKPLLLIAATELVVSAAIWLITSFRLKCRPMILLKKALPPFLVALTTASSMSAMPLSMETIENRLGVKRSTVSFVYPLGSVIYMPASVIYFTVLVFFFAENYPIEISLAWIVMAVVVTSLMVIALPPIPGAGILGHSILLATLGIPSEALMLAAATDIIADFFDTGFNVLLLFFQVADIAGRTGNMDRSVLLSEVRIGRYDAELTYVKRKKK